MASLNALAHDVIKSLYYNVSSDNKVPTDDYFNRLINKGLRFTTVF